MFNWLFNRKARAGVGDSTTQGITSRMLGNAQQLTARYEEMKTLAEGLPAGPEKDRLQAAIEKAGRQSALLASQISNADSMTLASDIRNRAHKLLRRHA